MRVGHTHCNAHGSRLIGMEPTRTTMRMYLPSVREGMSNFRRRLSNSSVFHLPQTGKLKSRSAVEIHLSILALFVSVRQRHNAQKWA